MGDGRIREVSGRDISNIIGNNGDSRIQMATNINTVSIGIIAGINKRDSGIIFLMSNKYKIPRTLDNPMRAMRMPIDSVMIGVIVWLLFFLFNGSLYGLIVAPICGYIYQRYRKRRLMRIGARMLHWYLPHQISPIKGGVRGHLRELKIKED